MAALSACTLLASRLPARELPDVPLPTRRPVHPTYPVSRAMADLWMLFPTEEEYLQVGRASGQGRQGWGCVEAAGQRGTAIDCCEA